TRLHRKRQRLNNEKQIQRQHDRDADESPLFTEHCKNEIGVMGGEEVELRLRPLFEAFAVNAAGADRDFRLRHLVAGAERIARGIEENRDALALIWLQENAPAEAGAEEADDDHDGPNAPA